LDRNQQGVRRRGRPKHTWKDLFRRKQENAAKQRTRLAGKSQMEMLHKSYVPSGTKFYTPVYVENSL
jgi:hypothetical protein